MLKALTTDQNRIPEGVLLRDLDFEEPFYEGLIYNPPARGVWNIVHTGMLIPESHQIYVCAQGCLRGVVLTAAEMNRMENMSWVSLREQDMWNGEMESRVIEGCSTIVDKMSVHPKCILVYLSCMHLFEGCDFKVIGEELSRRYPDINWVDCYMTPTMRKSKTPDALMKNSLYTAVKPLIKDPDYVGLIGCDHPMHTTSELYRIFELAGKKVWEITKCRTYAEYLSLGKSCALINPLPVADFGGRILSGKLGAPLLHAHLSYAEKEIKDTLILLAVSLGIDEASAAFAELLAYTDEAKKKADEALRHTLTFVGDTPVSIDHTATPRPLGLAVLLLQNGFRVNSLYVDGFAPAERSDFEWLRKNAPDLLIYPTFDPAMRFAHDRSRNAPKTLCIGQKAAYFNNSPYFVNIVEGGGMYGFDGIKELAEEMLSAFNTPKDMIKTISHKGLGCESCL